jgi:hypothetical protein
MKSDQGSGAFDELARVFPSARLDVRRFALEFEARVDIGDDHARARARSVAHAIERACVAMRAHLAPVPCATPVALAPLDAPGVAGDNARAAAHFAPVRLTRAAFDALPEYSGTLPTGTTIGKRWRRRVPFSRASPSYVPARWFMGEYVHDRDAPAGSVAIVWREIEIVDDPVEPAPGTSGDVRGLRREPSTGGAAEDIAGT